MIDIHFLESAKNIRKEFLKLNEEIRKYEIDIKNLSSFLLKKAEDLTKYDKEEISKIKSKEDVGKVSKHLLEEIEQIELEENKLVKKVTHINEKIEKLNYEENILYDNIKIKYPKLNDDEIIDEIRNYLKKNNL